MSISANHWARDVSVIAKRVGVAPSKVSIVRGGRSREKVVAVSGLDSTALDLALRDGD